MLIGYNPPQGITVIVAGATGHSLPAVVDGQPARVGRVLDGAGGSASIRADWAAAQPVRIVAALGLSCAAGTALALSGKRAGDSGYAYALGGNATTQAVVQLPDGSRAAWFVLPATNAELVGLQLTVAAGAFDIGELVILRGVELPITPAWQVERVDPSLNERTLGGGLNTVQRRCYRRLKAGLTPAFIDQVRGAALAGNTDWDALSSLLTGAARGAAIPRWAAPDGTLTPGEIHRTALYGRITLAPITHLGGNHYGSDVLAEEIPPK